MRRFFEVTTVVIFIVASGPIVFAAAVLAAICMVPVVVLWCFSRLFKPSPELHPS